MIKFISKLIKMVFGESFARRTLLVVLFLCYHPYYFNLVKTEFEKKKIAKIT